jgi:hypothetical protein
MPTPVCRFVRAILGAMIHQVLPLNTKVQRPMTRPVLAVCLSLAPRPSKVGVEGSFADAVQVGKKAILAPSYGKLALVVGSTTSLFPGLLCINETELGERGICRETVTTYRGAKELKPVISHPLSRDLSSTFPRLYSREQRGSLIGRC